MNEPYSLIKKCIVCGQVFRAGQFNQKTCGGECRRKHSNGVLPPTFANCEVCKTRFQKRTKLSRYCGRECSELARNERRRRHNETRPAEKSCQACGVAVSLRSSIGPFCCLTCRRKVYPIRPRQKGEVGKSCRSCGEVFWTKRDSTRQYCDQVCSQKHRNETRRAKRQADKGLHWSVLGKGPTISPEADKWFSRQDYLASLWDDQDGPPPAELTCDPPEWILAEVASVKRWIDSIKDEKDE